MGGWGITETGLCPRDAGLGLLTLSTALPPPPSKETQHPPILLVNHRLPLWSTPTPTWSAQPGSGLGCCSWLDPDEAQLPQLSLPPPPL